MTFNFTRHLTWPVRLTVVLGLVTAPLFQAAVLADAPYGSRCLPGYTVMDRPLCVDYSTGVPSSAAGPVLYTGLHADNADDFLQRLHDALFNTDTNACDLPQCIADPVTWGAWDNGSAAGIINIMMGVQGHELGSAAVSIQRARDSFNNGTFEALVRSYDSRHLVVWDELSVPAFVDTPTVHASANPSKQDVLFITTGLSSTEVITFHNPDGSLAFRIERDCGNFLGFNNSLVPPATATATCSTSTFPAYLNKDQLYSFTVSVNASSWDSGMSVGDPALGVIVRDPSGGTVFSNANVSYGHTGSGPIAITSAGISFTPASSGKYTAEWSFTGHGYNLTGCSAHGDTAFMPYFTVKGGDIASGGSIYSWNQDGGSYGGAGSQMAALATGNIRSFVTGSGLSGGAATGNGSGLAFANSNTGTGLYGGGYDVGFSVPSTATTPTVLTSANLDLSTLNSGVYTYGGDLSLHGTVLPGRNITIVLNGHNAYIDGNIVYSYSGASQIPRLNLYVTDGTITVKNDVTEIHGIFAVDGATAPQGSFYSCGTGPNAPMNMSSSDAYADCNHKLAIYGTVTAKRLVLSRTWGSYDGTSAPNEPAETFYYTPETWLGTGTRLVDGALRFDAYDSLAPVL